MNGLTGILKSSLSGQFELGRIIWALISLALIIYQGVAIWMNKQPFSPIEFGAGAGAILAAGGFGVAAKDKGVATAQNVADGVKVE